MRGARISSLVLAAVWVAMVAPAGASALPRGEIKSFATPTTNSGPFAITPGANGSLWYTEQLGNNIGDIVANSSGQGVSFPLPNTGAALNGITTGPNGDLYFAEGAADKIGVYDPSSAAFNSYNADPLGTYGGPWGITTGPDGNIWFTEQGGANAIGEFDPSTNTVINEYSTSKGLTGGGLNGIAVGPDGNLWFAEGANDKIGRIIPSTGAITEYATSGSPEYVTPGPDGNVWFTDYGANKVGYVNPYTGVVTEFSTPTTSSGPWGITAGPDGDLWFTEKSADKIGVINPFTDAITEFSIPTAGVDPEGIVTGSDGNLYFDESANPGGIGEVGANAEPAQLQPPVVSGSGQAGTQQTCGGDAWATWAGLQPRCGMSTHSTATAGSSPTTVCRRARAPRSGRMPATWGSA